MFLDQKYFDEMLKELIEQERHSEPGIEALEKMESAAEGLGATISKSGVSEITTREAIEKFPIAVIGLAVIEAIQSNASQERYIRLEQMKIQYVQATTLERIEKRLESIGVTLETSQESKLEGLCKHAFFLGHGDIDHEAALDDAMNEANDCFTEAVSCFHALSTVSRKVEQASYQEQFEFASKHHQLFVSYFSLFRAVYQRSLNEMAMRGVAGDE